MRKFFGPMGSVSRVTVESQVLKSNLLGDPSVCVVDVYIPAGHDRQELPLLVDLVGFTGSGLSHTNWVGFRENLPEIGERALLLATTHVMLSRRASDWTRPGIHFSACSHRGERRRRGLMPLTYC